LKEEIPKQKLNVLYPVQQSSFTFALQADVH